MRYGLLLLPRQLSAAAPPPWRPGDWPPWLPCMLVFSPEVGGGCEDLEVVYVRVCAGTCALY